jgi:hypothetical protein
LLISPFPLLFLISAKWSPSELLFREKKRVSPTVPVQILEKWRTHLAELASFACSHFSTGRTIVLSFEAKQSGEQKKKGHQGTKTEPDASKIKAGIRAWILASYTVSR